jgi:hypothetical protein
MLEDGETRVCQGFSQKVMVVSAITSEKTPLLFDWSVGKGEVQRCRSGGSTTSAKGIPLISYGFELVGDLLLNPSQNESCAPGMETFTGDLGKA